MDLEDIISLAQAAKDLGIAPVTLRAQAAAGRLQAKVVGKTWITTRQEVERYRRENLGQVGRPPGLSGRATHPVPRGTASHPVPRVRNARR